MHIQGKREKELRVKYGCPAKYGVRSRGWAGVMFLASPYSAGVALALLAGPNPRTHEQKEKQQKPKSTSSPFLPPSR